MYTNIQTDIHTSFNTVPLVWGSLRLAPTRIYSRPYWMRKYFMSVIMQSSMTEIPH